MTADSLDILDTGQALRLSSDHAQAVLAEVAAWEAGDRMRRLWAGDASLWTGAGEDRWLGWLEIVEGQLAHGGRFAEIAADARDGGLTHALVLGMGGSSLCPEVLARTFGTIGGHPRLLVLDSTNPAQVAAFEAEIDVARTLFVVSSKSGTTLEPNIFKQYFYDRARRALGEKRAGERFIAITDPGSKLERAAEAEGFRRVFHGVPKIGGRYSALSDFGMVPAAIQGVDVLRLLTRAEEMVNACRAAVAAGQNPGVTLGAVLGSLARRGRDKVTFIASPGVSSLGAWLEQLLAESTGKQGQGLIPVDGERPGATAVYGDDRLFAYLRLEADPDPEQDRAVAALEQAGQPVVRIELRDPYDLGREFFRWEMATAVAGAILGIDPFDQPDVEASKVATRALTSAYEETGSLPPEDPFLEAGGLAFFADPANASALLERAGLARGTARPGPETVERVLRAQLDRLAPGDYFATLAYVDMSAAHDAEIQGLRRAVRDAKRVATCVGFGPRFLHSTGQAYKGGPDTGVFLQITCDHARDLPVPGQAFTFGVVQAAQARGDFQVLAERGRRALRVHLGPDVAAGLARLREATVAALAT